MALAVGDWVTVGHGGDGVKTPPQNRRTGRLVSFSGTDYGVVRLDYYHDLVYVANADIATNETSATRPGVSIEDH